MASDGGSSDTAGASVEHGDGDIEAACRAAGIDATREQVLALSRYLDLLQRWNGAYNLSAIRDRGAMLSHHLADCLAIVPSLVKAQVAGRVLDVGSGGGLPGVVIAVLLPSLEVTCVDAVGKKAAFIRQVAGALGLPNLTAVHRRAEQIQGPPFDLIVCRAFSSLADLVGLTSHLLAPAGRWVAMKGKVPTEEMALLRQSRLAAEVFHVEHLEVPALEGERCLVWMRRLTGNSEIRGAP